MACYISSKQNRFYAALEQQYGKAAAWSQAKQFGAIRLDAKNWLERPARKDKTGSRTYTGSGGSLRRRTTFDIATYLYSHEAGGEPGYGALVQAALGGAPRVSGVKTLAANASGTGLRFSSPHGAAEGSALHFGGEIRFVTAVVDATELQINAPFLSPPAAGEEIGGAVSYAPAWTLPSATVFDCWSPATAVQRLLCGAAVDEFEVEVNGDYHEMRFQGFAADLIDSASFESGQGGLAEYPAERATAAYEAVPIPGHLGQVWIGASPTKFETLTSARIQVKNNLDARVKEYGWNTPRCIVPGDREATVEFELYSRDTLAYVELYQAARQQTAISMFVQLGERPGELMGVYLKSFVPEVPEYEDKEPRLRWKFEASKAQGTADDEIHIAFA
jgi:hypothetical protein